LDNYEEGVWTPSLEGSENKGTASYEIRNGEFVRIGSVVYLFFFIRCSAGSSLSGALGDLKVSGLPYMPSEANSFVGSVLMKNVQGPDLGRFPVCAAIVSPEASLGLFASSVGGHVGLNVQSVGSGFEVRGSITYFTRQK
jgi:hypothetical protein